MELPDNATVADLKAEVLRRYPGVAPVLDHTLVSINQAFAYDEDPVTDGSEVVKRAEVR